LIKAALAVLDLYSVPDGCIIPLINPAIEPISGVVAVTVAVGAILLGLIAA